MSVRGMHPDLLVLDDVLNDANSLSSEQRNQTSLHFMSPLMPMHAGQMLVVGTAIHQVDLLAQLGDPSSVGPDPLHTVLGFRSETYRALDEEAGRSLWPERFPAHMLLALRDHDPLTFSREYQNDPRDDASSLFPHELTERAIANGSHLVLGTSSPADVDEIVVLGVDVARSGGARADFTVALVVAWNVRDGTRRVLDIRREKGLELDAQVGLISDLVVRHRAAIAVVENNGFQKWLVDALIGRPETYGKVFGHRTGINKADGRDGIPRLALQFRAGSWVIPSGDRASLRLARIFQAELAAFGFHNGRLTGVGEHDDTVIAAWLVERAIEQVVELQPRYEIVYGEDVGIYPVKIGDDY
jgi:hypothetical protein